MLTELLLQALLTSRGPDGGLRVTPSHGSLTRGDRAYVVSLNEAAERLVKGGLPALDEWKCARATLLEFGAGRGEVPGREWGDWARELAAWGRPRRARLACVPTSFQALLEISRAGNRP